MRHHGRWVAAPMTLVGFLMLTLFVGCKRDVPEAGSGSTLTPVALRLEIPRFGTGGQGDLLLREESEGSSTLLIRPITPEEVGKYLRGVPGTDPREAWSCGTTFRYKLGATELEVTNADAWEAATGRVNRPSPRWPDSRRWSANYETERLKLDETVIQTAGKTLLDLAWSPDGKRVAVLSAEGKRAHGLIPFTGGSGAYGKHYCQILREADGTPEFPPIPLPFKRDDEPVLQSWWSSDGRYLVYANLYLEYLVILPVPPSKPETSRP